MAEPVTDNPTPAPGRSALILSAVLAIAALVVSAYLSYTTMAKGITPPGCGAGSGCAEVLTSKWSRWLGIPVSLMAVGVYVIILIALTRLRSNHPNTRRIGTWALSASASAIAGSALWFIYLQLFTVGAVCVYCMTGHILGLLLAILMIWRLRARQFLPGLLGLAGVVLMMLVQINTASMLATLGDLTPEHDADTLGSNGRTVSVLDGKLTLNLQQEPILGPSDAKRVIVLILDYACLHCRHTHNIIEQYQAEHPGKLVAVLLPMPLHSGCNPYVIEDSDPRFAESCELTRIALAVYLADAQAYPDFDRWLYEPVRPRSVENARQEAIRRLGREHFEQALANPRMQELIDRNVHIYGDSGADRVPVLIVPGSPAIVGRIDDADVLAGLLENPADKASQ